MDINKLKTELENISLMLREEGGDAQFIEYTPEKVVLLKLQGHCAECPYSQLTVKNGIETYLKSKFGDEILAVEAIN